jgi:hypothetical protein
MSCYPLKLIEKENRKEIKLLEKIRNFLPSEIICIIYNFMCGNAKFQYNKKYEFLKEKMQYDIKNQFVFYKSIQEKFELLDKIKICNYINTIIIPNHPLIIKKLWYISIENTVHCKGMNLLNRWNQHVLGNENSKDDIEINNIMKKRFSNAIYYYIIRSLEIYENMKKRNCYSFLDASHMFIKMDKIYYLFQSLSLLSNKM